VEQLAINNFKQSKTKTMKKAITNNLAAILTLTFLCIIVAAAIILHNSGAISFQSY